MVKYFSALSLLVIFPPPSYPQSYFSRTYTEAEGLINSKVYDVVQGKNGLLWFSTLHGCSTFDGIEWTGYSYPQTQPHRQYQKLFADSLGIVWAVSDDLEIDYFDGEKWSGYLILEHDSLDWGYVSDLDVLWRNNERIIAVSTTNLGIFLCRNGEYVNLLEGKGLHDNRIYCLDQIGGTIIAATGDGIAFIEPDTFKTLTAAELNLPSDKITGLTVEKTGKNASESQTPDYRIILNGLDWFGIYENNQFTLLAEFPCL